MDARWVLQEWHIWDSYFMDDAITTTWAPKSAAPPFGLLQLKPEEAITEAQTLKVYDARHMLVGAATELRTCLNMNPSQSFFRIHNTGMIASVRH